MARKKQNAVTYQTSTSNVRSLLIDRAPDVTERKMRILIQLRSGAGYVCKDFERLKELLENRDSKGKIYKVWLCEETRFPITINYESNGTE